MAPQPGATRKRQNENMFFEPGIRGRKTGLTVPDTGIRDEMGMEPIDNLFSSPEKTTVLAPPPPAARTAQTAALDSALKPASKQASTNSLKDVTRTPAAVPRSQALAPRFEAPKTATKGPAPEAQQPDNSEYQVPTADETNSIEESMQIGNSTMPEPAAVLTERRKSMYIPPPKSKSPTKTFLGSPARRHPSIQPMSSPTRGEGVIERKRVDKERVARKLNFSNGDDVFSQERHDALKPIQTVPKSPAPAAQSRAPIVKTPAQTNGKRKRVSLEKENSAQDEVHHENISAPDSVRSMPGAWEEPTPFPSQKKSDRSFDLSPSNLDDDEYVPQPMDIDGDIEMENNFQHLLERTATPDEVVEPPRALKPPKKQKRVSLEKQKEDKGKGKEVIIPEGKKSGRPKSKEKEKEKEAVIPMTQAAEYLAIDQASRIYSSDHEAVLPNAKKPKLLSKDVNRKINTKKASQLAKDMESSPIQIQRGPPRPRQAGLFILRRETPSLSSFPAARVGLGRPAIKPSAYWRNEDEEGDTIFEPAAPQPSRRKEPSSSPNVSGARKSSKQEIEEEINEEVELADLWETEPGRINGLVKEWNASDKSSDTVMERDDEIALSGLAIITRPIPGSEVQFAKTLTLPFFGSGMVDLPPGAIKKPKNARKMQMVFFVHKGNVKVTVNGNEFRISAGGMWQVPRGNFYSIENDYDKKARIFFSQGCEVKTELD